MIASPVCKFKEIHSSLRISIWSASYVGFAIKGVSQDFDIIFVTKLQLLEKKKLGERNLIMHLREKK